LALSVFSAIARAAMSRANAPSLSELPEESLAAVREQRAVIPARIMRSGTGARSAVSMIFEMTLILPQACCGSGKNLLVRA
jgi:hypothetical protein